MPNASISHGFWGNRGYDEREKSAAHRPIPYNASVLAFERFSVQNMLMNSVKAPYPLKAGLEVWTIDEDRSIQRWHLATEGMTSTKQGAPWWNGVGSQDLLAFAKRMAAAEGIHGRDVVGARIIRSTNRSNGHAVHSLQIIHRAKARQGER